MAETSEELENEKVAKELFIMVAKTTDSDSLRKKQLLWLTVSQDLVHGCVAPCALTS